MFNGSRDPPYPVCVPRVFILECVLTNWCLHSQRAPTLRLAFFFLICVINTAVFLNSGPDDVK